MHTYKKPTLFLVIRFHRASAVQERFSLRHCKCKVEKSGRMDPGFEERKHKGTSSTKMEKKAANPAKPLSH